MSMTVRLVAGFTGVLVTCFCSFGCDRQAPAQAPPPEIRILTVITPHNEAIRDAFSAGFSAWYAQNRAGRAHIRWLHRGTPQCVEYVREIPELRAQGAGYEPVDLMFGGGIADHTALAGEGLCRRIDLDEALERIPAQVYGMPTSGSERRWVATGLSSFGIFFNARDCVAREIAAPETWADLADPRFRGWVGLADPRASGSNREGMVLVLQHHGWGDGWAILLRTLANARALGARSGQVLAQVESGVSLATYAVNFDGMARAAQSDGAHDYVDPPDATAVTPDVISILTTGSEPEMARDFVQYVLSDEGQALWSVSRDKRRLPGETLYHYPIVPSVYEEMGDKLSISRNPLQTPFGPEIDHEQTLDYGALVKALIPAAAGENHIALQQVWQGLIDKGLPQEALAELTRPPFDAEAALEHGRALRAADADQIRAWIDEWRLHFAARYARVAEMLK